MVNQQGFSKELLPLHDGGFAISLLPRAEGKPYQIIIFRNALHTQDHVTACSEPTHAGSKRPRLQACNIFSQNSKRIAGL
ncbi:PREDICTED: uncharacterized protein LOC109158903 [Ipomoea nil]|uniref:uncharacterized protein LOC109158903 n=1 Tax=Ipomoea nil TaxID=35883 RepID=UPI000901F1A5|nr:PREDICTED: uncharacterized protein LOC109158903 [Ipomoea nil]